MANLLLAPLRKKRVYRRGTLNWMKKGDNCKTYDDIVAAAIDYRVGCLASAISFAEEYQYIEFCEAKLS